MMGRPIRQIQPDLTVILTQQDELEEHAGQSKAEDHENEFCQNHCVVGSHGFLPDNICVLVFLASPPVHSSTEFFASWAQSDEAACAEAPDRGTVDPIEGT
jgi:hypothetical protein